MLKNENFKFFYYDVGFKKGVYLTYKLPTWKEFKQWWSNVWRRNRKSNSS